MFIKHLLKQEGVFNYDIQSVRTLKTPTGIFKITIEIFDFPKS